MDGLPSLFAPDSLPISSAIVPAKARTRAKRRNAERAKPTDGQWPLDGDINVVLFAGVGGACQGLEDAGYPVHVAVNHDAVAIAAHRALNPHTRHLQADIYEVCPLEATQGRRVNILWMSPDCRDHSVAKGGAPRSKRVRSMPWQGCRWVGKLRKNGRGPSVVYLENVREIRGWGPLIAKRDKATGRVIKLVEVPDPKKRGKTKVVEVVAEKGEHVPVQQQALVRDPKRVGRHYRAWVRHMESLGVRYEDRDLTCADHGIPTSRKRLFGVGAFTDQAIVWPAATHAARRSEFVRTGALQPYRMAAEIINWSLPLPSIFDRKKDLADATRRRIAVGMKRFVIEAEQPFLVHLTHGSRDHDVRQPIPTITGAHRGEFAVVAPAVVPTTHTSSAMRVHDGAAPLPTLTAGVKGGEFAVMGATIVGAGGRAAQIPPISVDGPLNTSTTKEDRCVVAAHLTRYHGERRAGEVRGTDPADPLATQTTENRFGVVAATLVGVAHGDDAKSGSRTYDIQDALRTATGSNDQALIAAHLVEHRGESIGQPASGPLGSQTQIPHHGLVAAHLTKFQENSVGQEAAEPIDTVMAGAARFGVIGAFLEEHRSHSIGHTVDSPLHTQTGKDHSAVIGAAMIRTDMHQSNAACVFDSHEPINTITTGGGHAVLGATMVQTGYGERDGQAPRALDIGDPIGTQVAGGAKHGVVGAWMVKHYGGRVGSDATDALHTVTTEGHHSVASAWLVQHNTGVIGHTADDPLSTMTTVGTQQQVAAAYLTEFRGTSLDGQPVTEPAPTMCTGGERGGSHTGVTAAYITEYYSVGGQHQECGSPLNTLTTNDRFGITGAQLAPQLPPEKLQRARQVADFLRSFGCWDDREFVTVGPWLVVDIGMRMLTPAEAAAAHELKMPDLIEIDGVRRPLTKTEAMRLVGNSVPKRMAMLLAQANAHHTLYAPSYAQAAE